MIKGVLNLQDQKVREIMKPRVEVVAVPKSMSVASVFGVVRESGYSRIPVYDGEIDNIVGIVLAKSVLDFFVKGVLVDRDNRRANSQGSSANGREEEEESIKFDYANGEEEEEGASAAAAAAAVAMDLSKFSQIDPTTGDTMDRYV